MLKTTKTRIRVAEEVLKVEICKEKIIVAPTYMACCTNNGVRTHEYFFRHTTSMSIVGGISTLTHTHTHTRARICSARNKNNNDSVQA